MQGHLARLITATLDTDAADALLETFSFHESFLREDGPRISRAVYALALGAVLFDGLLKRVPAAAAYVSRPHIIDPRGIGRNR